MSIIDIIGNWWRGLRNSEAGAVTAARSLYNLLQTAPKLAEALLDLLPAIITEIRRLEQAMPEAGSGRRKLVEFVSWLEHEHGQALQRYASVTDIYVAARALASLVVQVLNATGMFRSDRV